MMTTRKRNEWLDDALSEDEGCGYDSEAAEESRSKALDRRASKRQKTSEDELSDDDDDDDEAEGFEDEEDGTEDVVELGGVAVPTEDDEIIEHPADAVAPSMQKSKNKSLSSKKIEASKVKASRTGVIYLSRVPPFMKPSAVRTLLQSYGEIGRIFLTPEDPSQHSRRVKSGGNKKRSFTDGWVEFLDKNNAKMVAEALNAHIIGGKKGGWYHDDVWNIKYLKGFKWHHLTEQISNENAERAARLRAEIAQTTRENKVFLENVERAKMLEGMEAKRKLKGKKKDAETVDQDTNPDLKESAGGKVKNRKMHFRQNEVKVKTSEKGKVEQNPDVKRVLSKIF